MMTIEVDQTEKAWGVYFNHQGRMTLFLEFKRLQDAEGCARKWRRLLQIE